ncbi:hypothetical protein ACMFMG_003800 [Clarireedia jacksonii]
MSASLPTAHFNYLPARPERHMTKKDWEQLKGDIIECYIHEKKTLSYISDCLKSKGFIVSRRTFTKKLSEWGLKKNYSKKERLEILKSARNIEQINSDHRVNKAKLQRWRKQIGHSQINELLSPAAPQNCSQDAPTNETEDLDQDWEMEVEVEVEVEARSTKQHQESSSIVLGRGLPERAPGIVANLAQVLSQLGLSVGPAVENDEDLAREELRAEATPDCRTLTKMQHYCTRTNDSFDSFPYREIGIFSTSRIKAPRLSWTDYAFKRNEVWPREIEQLKAKLSNSQPQVLPMTEKVSVMRKLAQLYHDSDRLGDSLEMQQQIVAAGKSQQYFNTYELLITHLETVNLHIKLHDYRTAAKVHKAIHSQIKIKLWPKHPIHLYSSYLYAIILYYQSHYSEGEEIIRAVVQITYGWNNAFSMGALNLLHWYMKVNSSVPLVYLENSLRLILNNCSDGSFIIDYNEWGMSAMHLLAVMISQGNYRASETLCSYVMERMGLVRGEDTAYYLWVQHYQAKIWYRQGKLSESYDLLCKVLNSLNISVFYNGDLQMRRDLFYDLAEVQEKLGEHREALKSWRKCLEVGIRAYRLQGEKSLDTCRCIGNCYQKLGRYDEALNFYAKVVERLRNSPDDDKYAALERIEKLGERTRENMEQARKKAGIIKVTSGDEGTDYDQGTDVEAVSDAANQEMMEEMNCDNDEDTDLMCNRADNIAYDDPDPQVDILDEFDWEAFLDYPTPLI